METVDREGGERLADLLRPMAGAVSGGAAGAAGWAFVSVTAGPELSWLAWAVGVLAGVGARAGAGGALSSTTGWIAAGAAVLSIVAAKAVVVHVDVDRQLAAFRGGEVSDELATSYLADEVAEAWEEAGRQLAWPADSPYDVPQVEADYPADLWAEAAHRFAAMDAGEREAYRRALVEERERDHAAFAAEWRRAGLRERFGPVDLVFLVLALASAYGIARGPVQVIRPGARSSRG